MLVIVVVSVVVSFTVVVVLYGAVVNCAFGLVIRSNNELILLMQSESQCLNMLSVLVMILIQKCVTFFIQNVVCQSVTEAPVITPMDSQSVYQDDVHRSLAVCLLFITLSYLNYVRGDCDANICLLSYSGCLFCSFIKYQSSLQLQSNYN